MLPLFILPLALVFGLATHPASAPAAGADSTVAVDANAPARVAFENQGWDIVTVYAVPQSGMAVRLGQVTPGATGRFTVPRSVVASASSIDLVAVPLARNYVVRSGPVAMSPGDAFSASLSSAGHLISVLPAR